ncbi:hypothetical protein MN608_11627 [Microdochium nivale]|nr:hypothetical protein MN608_11627 [Microdochium nivale]
MSSPTSSIRAPAGWTSDPATMNTPFYWGGGMSLGTRAAEARGLIDPEPLMRQGDQLGEHFLFESSHKLYLLDMASDRVSEIVEPKRQDDVIQALAGMSRTGEVSGVKLKDIPRNY